MNTLIVTTSRDLSLSGMVAALQPAGSVNVVHYDEAQLAITLSGQSYQLVYFRDPFNTGAYDRRRISRVIRQVRRRFPDARYVDQVGKLADMLIEDKWRQYHLLQRYMPPTRLLRATSRITEGEHIIKPRISSRGRGIVFRSEDIDKTQGYIIQPLLPLQHEYRVFCIGDEVIADVALKTSKTPRGRVKAIGVEPASSAVADMAAAVYRSLPWLDFMGLDIGETADGCVLLEANRSPQFTKYNELTGQNLFAKVVEKLL